MSGGVAGRSAPRPSDCSNGGGGGGGTGSGGGGGGGSHTAAPLWPATRRGAAARRGPAASRGWQRVAAVAAAAAVTAAVAVASFPTPIAAACASRLWSHPEEYARCRSGTTCFFFLVENPVMTLAPGFDTPDNPANPRVLFPCAEYRRRGLAGFGWTLHATLFPNNTDWCALAGGPGECTFNELISLYAAAAAEAGHPASGMGLAASGAWVFTEWRATRATASDPIYEVRHGCRGGVGLGGDGGRGWPSAGADRRGVAADPCTARGWKSGGEPGGGQCPASVRFLCRPAATDATDGVLFPPHSVMPPPPPSCSVPPVPVPAAPNPPQDQVALLVRRGAASDARPLRAVNLHALLRPFSHDAWLLVLAALVVWMAAAAAAAARVPTPVARHWSLRRRALQWLYNLYVGRDT